MKMGYVLMRYGLDANGNEISGSALCASTSYNKVYEKIRHIYDVEEQSLGEDEIIHDYDNQVVVEYGSEYDDWGVRYIIEGIEIL